MEERIGKTELTRHETRERAFQALFPSDFNAGLTKQDAIDYVSAYDSREIVSEDGEDLVPTYLDLLAGSVRNREAELDEMIADRLGNNWSMQCLAKIDIVILRSAILEMLCVSDVPNIVTLNETVESSKKYSSDRSRKLVNGMLSNVMKKVDSEA